MKLLPYLQQRNEKSHEFSLLQDQITCVQFWCSRTFHPINSSLSEKRLERSSINSWTFLSMLQLSLYVSFVLANLPPASPCQVPRPQPLLVISLSSECVSVWVVITKPIVGEEMSELNLKCLYLCYLSFLLSLALTQTHTHIRFNYVQISNFHVLLCSWCKISCITKTEGIRDLCKEVEDKQLLHK